LKWFELKIVIHVKRELAFGTCSAVQCANRKRQEPSTIAKKSQARSQAI